MKLNSMYEKSDVLDQMNDFFLKEGFLQLVEVLDKGKVDAARRALENVEFKKVYDPLVEKKRVLDLENTFEVEIIELVEYLKSPQFKELLEEVTQIDLTMTSLNVVSYEHRDYKILNDEIEQKEELHAFFDLTLDWKEEYGGILTYTTKEEELLYLEPQSNSLTLVYKDTSIMNYLKYVNHLSENKKIMRIEMTFDLN